MISWLNKLHGILSGTLGKMISLLPHHLWRLGCFLQTWGSPRWPLSICLLGLSQPVCTKRCLLCMFVQFWASQSIRQSGIASALVRGSHLGQSTVIRKCPVFPGCPATPFFNRAELQPLLSTLGQTPCVTQQQSRTWLSWCHFLIRERWAEIYPVIKSFPDKGMAYLPLGQP